MVDAGEAARLATLIAAAMLAHEAEKKAVDTVIKKPAKAAGRAVKKTAKKTKRAPTAYQKHMKKELAKLKKKHPRTSHQVLFKRAAKSWKGAKKR